MFSVVSIEADPCHPGTPSPSTGRNSLPGEGAFPSFVCKIRLSRVDLEPILNPPSHAALSLAGAGGHLSSTFGSIGIAG
jgi:hypothetical protein